MFLPNSEKRLEWKEYGFTHVCTLKTKSNTQNPGEQLWVASSRINSHSRVIIQSDHTHQKTMMKGWLLIKNLVKNNNNFWKNPCEKKKQKKKLLEKTNHWKKTFWKLFCWEECVCGWLNGCWNVWMILLPQSWANAVLPCKGLFWDSVRMEDMVCAFPHPPSERACTLISAINVQDTMPHSGADRDPHRPHRTYRKSWPHRVVCKSNPHRYRILLWNRMHHREWNFHHHTTSRCKHYRSTLESQSQRSLLTQSTWS